MSDVAKAKLSEKMKARSRVVMYRDGKGNEWSGMGARPAWVKTLVKRRGAKALEALVTDDYKAFKAAREAERAEAEQKAA